MIQMLPSRYKHQHNLQGMDEGYAMIGMQLLLLRVQQLWPIIVWMDNFNYFFSIHIWKSLQHYVFTPSMTRIQNPRNSWALQIFGVFASATSGLVWLNRMTDFEFCHPPMKISAIGCVSFGSPVKAKWASFAVRTLNWTKPLETG